MISFEDIVKANETLRFSDIKGKNYAEVPQRVKAFRMLYPEGFIETELVSNCDGVCIFKAKVGYYGEDGQQRVLGTGSAYEREGSSYINKTSYIENCETSAVGRALGFLNIGSDESIASYEEVANAITQQDEMKKKAKEEKFVPEYDARGAVKAYCEQAGMSADDFKRARAALVDAGIVRMISYDTMTEAECMALIRAVEQNRKAS